MISSDISDAPIGIFDSGIGGLTVYMAVRKLLPYENIVYLGDTARVPYGTKSADVVRQYSKTNTEFLLSKEVKVVVVACNTASASSISFLKKSFPDIPIFGVIEPTIAQLRSHSDNLSKIGVIGTNTTISSGVYQEKIGNLYPKMQILSKACPLFVPLVEEGVLENNLTFNTIDYYLSQWKAEDLDALLLGCTHYPLLIPALSHYFGESVEIIDSAKDTASHLQKILADRGVLNQSSQHGSDTIFVTDDIPLFKKTANLFMNTDGFNFFHI
ncbi:glutamate racemase [bacterium]|nr:glutamate racemase [bacterium]